ncbi:MAG: SsrA-binding protein SmpB [Christensenellaceae bacterium]|jgi:SsrA-binding protein|nr:SsrA-binding protein SmpB [Christensenellaceae bacterium]
MLLTNNKKAHFNYFVKDKWEAGLSLEGWEVKSIKAGKSSLDESFVQIVGGELFLKNAHVAHYENGDIREQNERRDRKLLLKKSELAKISKFVLIKGNAVVALNFHLTKRGLIKCEVATAVGKHTYDKKRVLKERDLAREARR